MARKVHLQGNAGKTREAMALCSIQYVSTADGIKARNNSRRSYVGMASEVVRFEEFKAAPEADRCAHCCTALLPMRNRQRAAKGLPPVTRYNEGWDA